MNHDGREAVARGGDGARRHDAGNGAREAREQRNEGAAGQSHPSHEPVEHEGGARQIARILERQDEEEQDQDLRQEHEHAAGAGDDAIEQQAAERSLRQHTAERGVEPLNAGVDQVLRCLGPAEHRLEHEKQHHREQRGTCDGVEHHGVEARQHPQPGRHAIAGFVQHAAHFALRGLDVGGARGRRRLDAERSSPFKGRRREAIGIERLDERALAARAYGHRRDHRYSERALERRTIERVAALRGEVAHVERHDHRPPEPLELQHQTEAEAQVRRIDHAHEEIRRGLGRVPAQHHVAGDGLIERRGLEAIGARQIDDAEAASGARTREAPFLALDRDAGVVGDFLAAARQAVEEGGLAAVRNADQGETELRRGQRRSRGGAHRCSSIQILCASRRRSASVV